MRASTSCPRARSFSVSCPVTSSRHRPRATRQGRRGRSSSRSSGTRCRAHRAAWRSRAAGIRRPSSRSPRTSRVVTACRSRCRSRGSSPASPRPRRVSWQERVVRHLGLGEWHRVVLHDEVDAIGPLARTRLVAHGVLWPPNLAGDVPLIEAVPGGSVIDGEGGDEVLGDTWHRVAELQQLVRAPWPLRKRRLRAALEAAAPARVRTSRVRRHWGDQLTWLTPAGRELVLDTLAREEAERPLRYAASLLMVPRKRKQVLAARNRRLLAAPSGVEITSPLLHQDFIDALARRRRRAGPRRPDSGAARPRPGPPSRRRTRPDQQGHLHQVLHGPPDARVRRALVRGGRRSRAGRRRRPAAVVGERDTRRPDRRALADRMAGRGRADGDNNGQFVGPRPCGRYGRLTYSNLTVSGGAVLHNN